jgi:hypothetical protein
LTKTFQKRSLSRNSPEDLLDEDVAGTN